MESKDRARIFEQIKNALEEKGIKNKTDRKGRYVAAYVAGIKAEYNFGSNPLAIKLIANGKNDQDSTMEQLNDWVAENYGLDSIVNKRKRASSNVLNFLENCSPEDFLEVVDNLTDAEFELEFTFSDGAKSDVLVGPTFTNTIFENLKERGATMSGMFGSLVCKASDMKLENTLAEYYTAAGEIDGVEVDPENGDVLAIYECQAGIHNGAYLDETHFNKAFGKYLYDSKVIHTVRKVVVLAGGYYDDQINMITERAKELGRRDNPIEVVLLKTVKVDGKISITRVKL